MSSRMRLLVRREQRPLRCARLGVREVRQTQREREYEVSLLGWHKVCSSSSDSLVTRTQVVDLLGDRTAVMIAYWQVDQGEREQEREREGKGRGGGRGRGRAGESWGYVAGEGRRSIRKVLSTHETA
eukprot:768457-Hanusia_phi.AAC.3